MKNYKITGTVEKDFTKVPKVIIRDTSISCEARIILSFLIDLAGEFSVNERGLSTILGISVYKVGKAINELERSGYICKRRIMNKTQFAGWFWDISVEPIFNSDNPYIDFSDMENSDTKISDMSFSDMEISDMSFSDTKNQFYIKDRKDIRPIDTRLKEEETKGEETEEREFTPTLTPLNQSGESVISSGELNTIQAFNRFCEVYPKVGDIDKARAAFLAIPDIDKICNQITNSIEWFEKTGRWNDWKTGQKNVSCPQAVKFLTRGDWREYLNSGQTMSYRERLNAILPDEEESI